MQPHSVVMTTAKCVIACRLHEATLALLIVRRWIETWLCFGPNDIQCRMFEGLINN